MTPMLLSPPASEPLSLAEARAWLRVDSDAEDAGITALIAAARMSVESHAGRRLIAQDWRFIADAWPGDGVIRLPLSPLLSVIGVRVLDSAGAAILVPATAYRAEPARDGLVLTGLPPQPGRARSGIEIDVTLGFGPAASAVPEPLRHAVRLLVARWYERRGDEADGAALPTDIGLLIAPFRAPRLA